MRKSRIQVSAEEFVRVFQSSSCAEEVALRTARTIGAVYSRASYYRMTGIPLKYWGKPRKHPMGLDRKFLRSLVTKWHKTMSKAG